MDPLAAAEEALTDAERRAARPRGPALGGAPRRGDSVRRGRRGRAARARHGGRGVRGRGLRSRARGERARTTVAFLIRPNPGLPLAPVAETASGGELSRVALALRAVAHAGAGEPTIVFDEIDAGIGGRTAHAVAEALGRLAERAQVLTITHLPQIASAAETHFRVEKVPGDPTHTRIERLAESARREEVERMLGGAEFIEAVRQ